MSEFFNRSLSCLKPYVPGEQPQDKIYIKLNTNESPFKPAKGVNNAVKNVCEGLNLYCDPACTSLRKKFAEYYNVKPDNVVFGNGSDEILSFCFQAFCENGVAFPDITYGFYEVFSNLYGLKASVISIDENFNIKPEDYANINKTIVIANPNAPTGLILSIQDIEKILKWNPANIVIIDEAYIDFGGESSVSLVEKYNNLIVVGTFSKSRSLAGARLGYAISNTEIIADINRIRYSINPYNVNAMTQIVGEASILDDAYFKKCLCKTLDIRQNTVAELREMGFICKDSYSNFVFAMHPEYSGEELYLSLRKKGVLVRWFNKERIYNYIRITIGTQQEMHIMLKYLNEIIEKH